MQYLRDNAGILEASANGTVWEPVVLGEGGGGVTDHTALTNIGTQTHAQIDTHIADTGIHGGGGVTDHTALTNIGTQTHAQIDSHIADTGIHGGGGGSLPNIVDLDEAAIGNAMYVMNPSSYPSGTIFICDESMEFGLPDPASYTIPSGYTLSFFAKYNALYLMAPSITIGSGSGNEISLPGVPDPGSLEIIKNDPPANGDFIALTWIGSNRWIATQKAGAWIEYVAGG